MSWTEKELKRRAAKSQPPSVSHVPVASEATRMGDLWSRMKEANAALPAELQLTVDVASSIPASAEELGFLEWLRAPGGAALGFAGDAIRYVWPVTSERRSNNFWIRWHPLRQMYVLTQRKSASIPPAVAEYKFEEKRVEYMLKCLVLGKRIKARSLRKRRLWLF